MKKRDPKKRRRRNYKEQKDEFDQKIVDLARVTRVMAGGKRMRFRATVAVGDKKGRVGIGLAKGSDVTIAVNKAVRQAKKQLLQLRLIDGTIPHEVVSKFCGAQVLLKPARQGRGLIAGGPIRIVLELAGVKNIVTKMQGSKNKVNNVKAVMKALRSLKYPPVAEKKVEKKKEVTVNKKK